MSQDPHLFESNVRRIARFRWPSAENCGSEIIDGRERDGVFVTEECIHLVECTVSRKKEKALNDLKKLFDLYQKYRKTHPDRAVKCWFITSEEPTADQRECCRLIKGAVPEIFSVVSFSIFQSKLVDSFSYLQARESHKFGSVYDPKTGVTTAIPKYISVTLRCSGQRDGVSVADIATGAESGQRFTLLGDYGVGKSMTLHEVFRCLAKHHRRSESPKFPVFLNLREHQGQVNPAEILERHARNIGFPNPSQLVRAWKAGYLTLLLDGFDEVSSLGLQGAWRRLREARQASMAGIRNLVRDSPTDCGIVIAGRDNFFDTADERRVALGQDLGWSEVRLDEFTESQIRELVEQFGFRGVIPAWIPTRPLLLSTLFARGGLSPNATAALADLQDPAAGWNLLLNEVCEREARIEHGISGENIRTILESLATLARSRDSGLGPVSPQDIVRIFRSECGYDPADEALLVVQRLPGLGHDSTDAGDSRCFVDLELAGACRAGDVIRFAEDPYGNNRQDALAQTKTAIGQTGLAVASHILSGRQFTSGKLTASIRAADRLNPRGALLADLVQIGASLGFPITETIFVSDLLFDRMEFVGSCLALDKLVFTNCYFRILEIAPSLEPSHCPLFQSCFILEIEGRVSERDMPSGRFVDCVIESYEQPLGGGGGALALRIPVGARVLMSVLKKLFVQDLGGRKENAFYRGLDTAHQAKVSDVLSLVRQHGLATPSGRAGEPIWLPVRRLRPRVMAILDSPNESSDPVVVAARGV